MNFHESSSSGYWKRTGLRLRWRVRNRIYQKQTIVNGVEKWERKTFMTPEDLWWGGTNNQEKDKVTDGEVSRNDQGRIVWLYNLVGVPWNKMKRWIWVNKPKNISGYRKSMKEIRLRKKKPWDPRDECIVDLNLEIFRTDKWYRFWWLEGVFRQRGTRSIESFS